MKPAFLLLTGLLAAAPLHAQTTKPGTASLVFFDSVITTQATPVVTPVTGGTRTSYSSTAVRFSNREILDAMRVASLLDGTIAGWQLGRLANPAGVGRLYALKSGKAGVLVPANLLTEPVVTNSAATGAESTATGGATLTNLNRKVFGTVNVRGGAGNVAGSQVLRSTELKLGSTTTLVQNRGDTFTVIGKAATATSVVSGNYQTLRSTPGDLAPYLPGSTVP
ncbi:MAG: hypothetical protein CFE26_02760 [Verrucomicrobiales bacterium VVV1]|nr:MAG: hypothetical protein CFE26_02760 [Verrucomicrobiales bacterium VVV1]